jgi:methanogenic corrinoid protein MtbC1
MENSSEFISPKQAARAIGVSESSLKRWCDQGLIKTVRTAGGHRKMAVAEFLGFVRQHNHQLVSAEVLGLPPASDQAALGLSRGRSRLVDALLAGDELLSRQILFDLYVARHSISVICDKVIAAAFREIGERWACDEADVFQERRACEIAVRILYELRRLLKPIAPTLLALGGAIDGDFYTLPTTMAELVLRDVGFQATSLGVSIPFSSLTSAIQQNRPKVFWLSVSHIREGLDFVTEFATLSRACTSNGTALVVGGRALTDDLRQRLTYSSFCDTMQHLEAFARALIPSRPE